MNEQKNTSSWKVSKLLNGCVFIEDRDSDTVCDFYFISDGLIYQHPNAEENARRIVACVNACEGIELSFIEALIPLNGFNSIIKGAADLSRAYGVIDKENDSLIADYEALQARVKELEAQRDELLLALKAAETVVRNCGFPKGASAIYELIAKIEAESQK